MKERKSPRIILLRLAGTARDAIGAVKRRSRPGRGRGKTNSV